MAVLFPPMPVFLDLIGRAVVVCAGDGRAAAFARDCLEAGAGVACIHPNPGKEMRSLSPRVKLILRRWRAADFRNAAVAACGADERRPSRARASAKNARAIFLMLDGSDASDFSLGETTARGPLTIGVSTTGLPQALAEALRDHIEASVPAAIIGFLEAAARHGGHVGGDAAARRRFWAQALAAATSARVEDWGGWLEQRISALAESELARQAENLQRERQRAECLQTE